MLLTTLAAAIVANTQSNNRMHVGQKVMSKLYAARYRFCRVPDEFETGKLGATNTASRDAARAWERAETAAIDRAELLIPNGF